MLQNSCQTGLTTLSKLILISEFTLFTMNSDNVVYFQIFCILKIIQQFFYVNTVGNNPDPIKRSLATNSTHNVFQSQCMCKHFMSFVFPREAQFSILLITYGSFYKDHKAQKIRNNRGRY